MAKSNLDGAILFSIQRKNPESYYYKENISFYPNLHLNPHLLKRWLTKAAV